MGISRIQVCLELVSQSYWSTPSPRFIEIYSAWRARAVSATIVTIQRMAFPIAAVLIFSIWQTPQLQGLVERN
jgi:hypothetical protein